MSLDLALSIARSGLASIQRNLAQTAQNIANAETPGYTRKTVPQQAMAVADLPLGLRNADARRAVDTALVNQLNGSRGTVAAATVREALLRGIEQAHGAAGDGATLGDAVSALGDAFTLLRAAPADAGQQHAVLVAATTLTTRLGDLSRAIGGARQQAQDGIVQEVSAANAALRDIAALTIQIKARPPGGSAELEDRRDQAIATLGESMEVQAVHRPNGEVLLIARGGIALPLDPDRDVLGTLQATVGPETFHGAGGSLSGVTLNGSDITGQISGGRLGEYLSLRDRVLPRYQAETDLVAANLADRFARQGLALFTDADGTTVPDPAQPYAGSAQVGLAGRLRLSLAVTAAPRLLRDGTDVVAGGPGGPSAFTPNPPGGPAGFTGLLDRVLTYSLGAEAAAGVAWAPIAGNGLGPDGTLQSPFPAPATLSGYADSVTVAQLGDRAAATAVREGAAGLQTALEARFAAGSGVDVDAEMAGMVTLQNAYAANARVISTLQAMWDALLATRS
ncbi:flagellar basal body rod C-terminal domain-containing protein [Paeniroseomonas aquatica]|uniref:Flagellar hook-associated protein 1 n=1 Tax=Paeniroseomonas aquatica TaxID=373043 RepID=A0ABT8AFK0_9PROT|nr:flagellar basal body rod C-terminal domain-containing protein [Paeniroseomonas aquatica]MDN3568551.1 flagellar basal body rod C-terminal domain-containing protein [Paeniroseomonas aquatica]